MDINIQRGITHPPLLLIFEDDNGDQVDLSLWGVESQARKKPGASPILDLKPVILPTGVLIGYVGEVDGPGRIKLADFSDEETLAMTNQKALLWDLVLLPPDGRRLYPGAAGGCTVVTIITEE